MSQNDDLISRREAIDALTEYGSGNDIYMSVRELKRRIEALPSAQPEIIRCKDCKHYYYADNRIPQEQRYSCDLDGDRWTSDSFCSFAERREE